MEQYIKKSALVAEIEKRIKEISKECEESKTIQFTLIGKINALENLLPFLNTLEVKEVDLEKEIEKEWLNCDLCRENTILEYANMDIKKFRTITKHFFELGLKTKRE